jgi:uncharacterized protein with ParB-like and HNH nuclease domain
MVTKSRRIDSQAQSIGEILRKPISYRVPVYQRDFAWGTEQIDALWEDIKLAIEQSTGDYFLGAIVLASTDSERSLEIVDGQQRLTVISLLFSLIQDYWRKKKDDNRALGIFRDFLGTEDRRTGAVRPKLSLNEVNDPVYQQHVISGKPISVSDRKLLPKSNQLLIGARDRLASHLNSWLSSRGDQDDLILDLDQFLDTKIHMIVIQVDDESDAFTLFETLNDRGLELAVSDLVKNYLFSLGRENLERFKKAWSDISLLLGGENLTQFLRHFWLARFGLVREKELYREMRREVKSPTKARAFIEDLRKAAELYSALMNPEHPFWTDFEPEARTHLEALNIFGVTQFRAVALAAMEYLPPPTVTKILHILMVVSFRYTMISGLGTGNLENIYSRTALAITKGKVKTPKEVFALLKTAYIDDSRFQQDFRERTYSKPNVARYVLALINDHIEQDPEKTVAERTGRITLEHIMPKTQGPAWKAAVEASENYDEFVERIGNLTLLEKGKNRGVSNSGFKEKKKKAFSSSTLALNKELCALPDWRSSDIASRSERLAKIAVQVWRLDY